MGIQSFMKIFVEKWIRSHILNVQIFIERQKFIEISLNMCKSHEIRDFILQSK